MSMLKIQGGHRLGGSVRIHGMKNAVGPLLAATLLTKDECVLTNVPRIKDVERLIEILKLMGSDIAWRGEDALVCCASDVDVTALASDGEAGTKEALHRAVKSLRMSVLLLGPLLARFGEVRMPEPGGCIIGKRPLTTHVQALRALGADVEQSDGMIECRTRKLHAAEVILPEFSVTATENLLMAASMVEGRTTIRVAAMEPHVEQLSTVLTQMGARIRGIGTHTLVIEGSRSLKGFHAQVIPDGQEIGTYVVAAAVCRGSITCCSVEIEHLHAILERARAAGIECRVDGATLTARGSNSLRAFRLQALPYPGFPSDLQAPFGLLATQCAGTSLIHDPLFEGRMGYVGELVKMGANAVVCDPHRVLVTGPTPLYGTEIRSLDLRAGATLVLAALAAHGQSLIHDAEIIDRGYESLVEQLSRLGASITRV